MERYISDCAWEAGFPEDVVVMPVAISKNAIKNSPIRKSVFIKKIYHEGVPYEGHNGTATISVERG
ncbi:MAG: hypothetical protein MRK01_04705 [Candidatus Scalindua sp.]|nr:hypothetical protein [Candidatus Scalindua sp.]